MVGFYWLVAISQHIQPHWTYIRPIVANCVIVPNTRRVNILICQAQYYILHYKIRRSLCIDIVNMAQNSYKA